MRVLQIGTDTDILKSGSQTQKRIQAYGKVFDVLDVIVYSPPGFKPQKLSNNVCLWPTNSVLFFMRPFDAFRIGKKLFREKRIDVISVQDPAESGLAGWLLKRKTVTPLHIQLHADFFSPFFRKNSWEERLRYWLACFLMPKGDGFRVVSARIKNSLHSKFQIPNSKITVLPIFVDREAIARAAPQFNLHEKYPEFDFIILMVSRLVREKNIGLAFKALSEFLQAFPKTGLVIVGDGPEGVSLKFKVKSLKLDDYVRFEGEMRQSDLVSYYKTADLYLLTSNFEGYGRSVVEAATAGIPIVMTDVGVAGELIRNQESGLVVPVGNKDALATALLWARQNYGALGQMARAAKEAVISMPPRKFEEYLEAYCDALQMP